MKIYTRTGDQGSTGLFGGGRVPKHDLRIEAYGSLDELNAWIGMLRSVGGDSLDGELALIQSYLFTLGSHLATEEESLRSKLPPLLHEPEARLESAIDRMDAELEPLRNFILPTGTPLVAHCHVARTVCRRAERRTAALAEEQSLDGSILRYLNRLSDYLFVLARWASKSTQSPEQIWTP